MTDFKSAMGIMGLCSLEGRQEGSNIGKNGGIPHTSTDDLG